LTAVVAGFALDIGVLLGLLLLTGVYVRATLLLHARYQELGIRAGHRPEGEIILSGARDRFVPVISTLVAVAGLALPAAVMGRDPGLELLQPMAAVTLGGLVTTALIVLLAVPLLYHRTAPDLDGTRFEDPTPAENQPLMGAR
jgi:Cu/Ag efflux pump CusA